MECGSGEGDVSHVGVLFGVFAAGSHVRLSE